MRKFRVGRVVDESRGESSSPGVEWHSRPQVRAGRSAREGRGGGGREREHNKDGGESETARTRMRRGGRAGRRKRDEAKMWTEGSRNERGQSYATQRSVTT